MAVPATSAGFPDILTPEFKQIFEDRYDQLPDMLPQLYNFEGTGPRRDSTKWSSTGTLPDFNEFGGSVQYQELFQGYDTTATHKEWAQGMQVKRDLFDDDLSNTFNQRPRALANSAGRTRQKHGARIFVNAFTVDTFFYNNTEGVSMCSNSHTTTSGASTASGFDNLGTSSLTAAAVSAARIQMRGYRGDQAERISIMPDEMLVPVDLEDKALEIIKSENDPASANNAINPQRDRYRLMVWNYLTDTNNWFLMDGSQRNEMLYWVDRIPVEFGQIQDFDTFVGKWRAYMRYSNAWIDWRFIFGASVS